MPRQPNISAQTLNLLAALLEHSENWHHGYDLSMRTGLKSGTLYPILMRLSEQGFLESEWLEPSKPGRPGLLGSSHSDSRKPCSPRRIRIG